jgi:hypothetical protein
MPIVAARADHALYPGNGGILFVYTQAVHLLAYYYLTRADSYTGIKFI